MIGWFKRKAKEQTPARGRISPNALAAARAIPEVRQFEPYMPPPGVIPEAKRSEALALDATAYDYVNQAYVANYFPGYQFLAQLAQLPEYRKFGEIPAKDMTRKWIKSQAQGDLKADADKTAKIAKIEASLRKHNVRTLFRRAAELDAYFGRAQIFIDVKTPKGDADDKELETPLFIAAAKIKQGALKGFRIVEPVWTYPSAYNAQDPLRADFYRPSAWYVMGKTVHASRLLSFISRPVPDLLKAAYNFGGLSMSQMAQPYVANWLRTRDSVSDLVHSFSVSGVKTDMSTVLQGTDDAQFAARAQLFNAYRDNRGLMLIDKDHEDFFQFNTPLSGVDALQAQAQEQMSSVSNIPLVKLLGTQPAGLNATSEGEIQVYYDYLASMQEAIFREPLTKIIDIIQLDEFGEIDPDIVFEFESLYGMTDVEKATVRKSDADRDAVLVSIGAVSPDEVRQRVASDPESGYDMLEGEIEDDDDPDLGARKELLTVKSRINDQ